MEEGKVAIYEVSVNGEIRKAIDLFTLKQFLELKKLNYSILNINVNDIESDERIMDYIAKAAVDTLAEIEFTCDKELGLVEEVEEIDQPVKARRQEPEIVREVPQKKQDPVVDAALTDEDEDEIVL
jgi:hypothetical protein